MDPFMFAVLLLVLVFIAVAVHTVLRLARFAFEIAECHLAVVIGNDIVFTDHAAV